MEDKPKRTPTNFGGWYWVHLLVMLAWSAVCLGNGTTALRSGHLAYGIVMIGLAGLGLACLAAWYPLQNRQPTAQDRPYRFPILVLGVFDAFVLGGGILVQEIHLRLVPGTGESSTLSLVIGGLCALVGIGYLKAGLAERRQMRQSEPPAEPPAPKTPAEPPAKPEQDDESDGTADE